MITTFGEIMLRLSPNRKDERINQAVEFRVEPGGSESNVAIALSNLGMKARFVTKLPSNPLTDKILQYLHQFKIDTKHIKIDGEKLGIYWTENGIGPRNSYVIYDRSNSAFSSIKNNDFNWADILSDSTWFHFSGISPAVSSKVNSSLLKAIKDIKIPYSIDLNYRNKLWNWVNNKKSDVNNIMTNLCSGAELIAGNESDFQNVFNISSTLKTEEEIYSDIAKKCFNKFHNINYIAISNRKSISASNNIWNGFLFVKNDKTFMYKVDEIELESIQDRVGTGDSFVSGIIYGLLHKNSFSYQKIVEFAIALSSLNHTTMGDSSRFSLEDVKNTMKTKGSGRIIR